MKYSIASDIHGSAFYCAKMLEACEREKADRMILLGDILYHGPRNDLPEGYDPKAVIEMLNAHKDDIYCVRGNCEAEVDQMVLKFPVMAEYMLLNAGNRMIFITHGHIFNKDRLPPMHPGDILLHGHTHIPAKEEIGECFYLNPGSISIPKNDTPRSYMILEDDTFCWKDLEGNVYDTFVM